jgi:hypothetical protein
MKKYLLVSLVSLSVFGLTQFFNSPVQAQFDAAKEESCEGIGVSGTNPDTGEEFDFVNCDDPNIGASNIDSILEIALNLLSLVAGVIAVIMIIIAGIKFLTSQGDPAKVASARNTVIYAIVGIIIVAMSQIIVRFVIDRAAGDPLPPSESQIREQEEREEQDRMCNEQGFC